MFQLQVLFEILFCSRFEKVEVHCLFYFRSLVEACTDGDVGTVRKLLTEGRSVHETTEEGESLLSLACSAGYFELAQVKTQKCFIVTNKIYFFFWF